LKKVQGKKKRDTVARNLEAAALKEAEAEAATVDHPLNNDNDTQVSTDLLSSKDEDVIF